MPSSGQSLFKGGINWQLPAWHPDIKKKMQCVLMKNYRYKDDFIDSIPGTKRYHGTQLQNAPVTAILPYYNDQTDVYIGLGACGDAIYKKNEQSNEYTEIKSALTPNSIFTSAMRYDTLYIASVNDGLKKYLGGNVIETVGGGDTAPGSFRVIIYMKEIDRLFGISDNAILGQITWCDFGNPEIWDPANVERFKLKKGERVEGAEILFGKLIIFCTYSTWIYYVSGNEENWRLEEAPTTIGCVAPNTIRKVGSSIWFLGEGPELELGVYRFNGSTSEILTHDIEPMFKMINRNRLRWACAEVHDDLYTISFSSDFYVINNISVDLDTINTKSDGTPAIYGPHSFGFVSSCVLNGRQNNKQFLMGCEDGFIYYENGTTFKSTNGVDGDLIEQRFLSRIHNEEKIDVMKQYNSLSLFFRPRGYFSAKLGFYISNGSMINTFDFNNNASWVGFAGSFNAYFNHLEGTPERYEFQEYPGINAQGTAIQIEVLNQQLNGRPAFDAYKYSYDELYTTQRMQRYAF